MKLFKKGQIIAAPFFSEQKGRYLRSPGGKSSLYPARVLVGNSDAIALRPGIIIKYLDGMPAHPMCISDPSTCYHLYEKTVPRAEFCRGFATQIETHRRGPQKTALQMWRARKSATGRHLNRDKVDTHGRRTATAKWRQRCGTTGERIEPGDSIVKDSKGWSLELETPPVSPTAVPSLKQRPPRRSKRIAAQKACSS